VTRHAWVTPCVLHPLAIIAQGLSDQPQPLDAEISEGEAVELAGTVLSVFEGMVVLQGPENSRALSEG
jgi:hypothetical protein